MRSLKNLVILVVVLITLAGCESSKIPEESPTDSIKLIELAPTPPIQVQENVGMLSLDVHQYLVPEERLRDLRSLWKGMRTRGIRYRSSDAFRANGFRMGITNIQKWDWIDGSLIEARAQRQKTITTMVTTDLPYDLLIAPLPNPRSITQINTQGDIETARLHPGKLVLRLQAWPEPLLARYRLIGLPSATLNISERIPELANRMRQYEVEFQNAAFSAPLRPGDVLVIGPEEQFGDPDSLGDLYFRHQEGIYFMDQIQPDHPKNLPAVKLYIFICTGAKQMGVSS